MNFKKQTEFDDTTFKKYDTVRDDEKNKPARTDRIVEISYDKL